MPSTAGSPNARAMIAVCPWGLPIWAARPAIASGLSWAASAGVSSSATRMQPRGSDEGGLLSSFFSRKAISRLPISRMSSTRADRYGSSICRKASAISATSILTASSALIRSLAIRARAPRTSRESLRMWT